MTILATRIYSFLISAAVFGSLAVAQDQQYSQMPSQSGSTYNDTIYAPWSTDQQSVVPGTNGPENNALPQSPAASTPKEEAGKESKKDPKKPGFQTCCHGKTIDWSKYPETIHPMPRPGIFSIAPTTGPAYFTVLDGLQGNCLESPRKSGYAPFAINAWPYFDADWRFVESLPCEDRNFVERMKRIHLNDCWLLSTGGQTWLKYHHEQNSRLTEAVNDYTQLNFRVYTDLWYSDKLRVYGEYNWADIAGEELLPTPPDVDRGDIQNLFVDLKLFEWADKPVYIRGGRQELLYGSQRLISPLPWANKRNSFDGLKLFRQGEKWDYDLFWAQFVPPNANDFDTPDNNQNLVGSWLTYRPEKGTAVDMYYLLFDNDNNSVQQGIVRTPSETHTMGSRWSGDKDGRLWDFEGAIQFGEQANNDLFAGMATGGLGRHWKDARWNPTAWLYYDYASGDSDPTAGTVNTFNQLFPFGHYYHGWADLVGRQNIHDLNSHLYLYPAPWCTVWLQYHHFWLDQNQDALYNAGGVAIRRDPTGQAGSNVGDEVDLALNFHLTNYSDILLSYNKLFGGRFLEETAGVNQAEDAETLYLIFQQRW